MGNLTFVGEVVSHATAGAIYGAGAGLMAGAMVWAMGEVSAKASFDTSLYRFVITKDNMLNTGNINTILISFIGGGAVAGAAAHTGNFLVQRTISFLDRKAVMLASYLPSCFQA